MTEGGKKPLGIYFHIPFCVRKCLYCDFLSGPADADTIQDYVNLILREIELETGQGGLKDYEAATIFFGGGTPSLLSPLQIDSILCKLRNRLPVREDAEITMEMNPGTVTGRTLAEYKETGVNRVSIGVQSLQDNELAALGRIHGAEDFLRMWEWTGETGYVNRNLDLMTGIPGQTEESLYDTLSKAAALKPEHISAYSLIVEEGTPFFTMYPDGAVDEETDRRLYALTKEVLKERGYERYEISNYAKPGFECRHNITYWTRGEYLGFGVGAASMMENVRFRNADTIKDYVNQLERREAGGTHLQVERLTREDCMAETMFLGLRMTAGVSENEFFARYGVTPGEAYGEALQKHIRDGLLVRERGRLFLTDRGVDVSNYVMADFLP